MSDVDEDVSFNLIRLDEDAYVVGDYATKKKIMVNIFVEHDVDDICGLVDILKCVIMEM